MKNSAQFVAAVLVVAVIAPRVFGFGRCCEHKPSASGMMIHHDCGHEQINEPGSADRSLFAKDCQCRLCPSALPKPTDGQVPPMAAAAFSQPSVAKAPLAMVPMRLSFYADPPPEDSSVRRASLCTLLI